MGQQAVLSHIASLLHSWLQRETLSLSPELLCPGWPLLLSWSVMLLPCMDVHPCRCFAGLE